MLQVSRQMAAHEGGVTFDRRNSVETSNYSDYRSSSNYHSFPSYFAEETALPTGTQGSNNYGPSSLNSKSVSAPPTMTDPRQNRSPQNSRQHSYEAAIYQNLPLMDEPTNAQSSRHSPGNSMLAESSNSMYYHNLPFMDQPSSRHSAPQVHHDVPSGLIPRSGPSSAPSSLVSHKNSNVGPSGLATHQYVQGSSIQGSAYYQPPSEGQRSLSPKATPQTTHSSGPVPAPRQRQQIPTTQPPLTQQPVPKPRSRRGSSDINQVPSTSRGKERAESKNVSAATLENVRYSLEHLHSSDHENEDRYFVMDKGLFQVFAVFDGHDGQRAAGFTSNYMWQLFESESWKSVVKQGGEKIPDVLRAFFKDTEKEFFQSIQGYVDERKRLQARIPQHLKSYEAYQRYPTVVKRIQEIEPLISGGCTAVVAVIANNKLYVANVGDSRAVLIFERHNGTLAARQLSVDHSVENEEEIKRLESLGLNVKQVTSSGRLGTQDNTRSIGDYNIKGGYKDVDVLSSATSQPGIAEPYVMPAMELKSNLCYLVLMSDGVYKSIEAMFKDKDCIEANKVLLSMVDKAIQQERTFTTVSDGVLSRLRQNHQDAYERHARVDPRSPIATACRKRDDMTLIVYKFSS